MVKIFVDDKRKIGVEESKERVSFFVRGGKDIIPALHYVETYPSVRGKDIEVIETIQLPIDVEVETFMPNLIPDYAGNTYGYQNYNFVLLNSGMSHSFVQIIRDFAEFISLMRKPRRKKLKIEDVRPEHFSGLLRVVEMKKIGSRREFYTFTRGENGSLEAMYLYSEKFSDGLRNRVGLNGGFNESSLDERVYIG